MEKIKLSGKFPVTMSINDFKKWFSENKEAVLKLSTKYINNHIVIADDKGNTYKYIRRKDEAQIVPRETLKTKRQMIDEIEHLKTLYKELEFMEEKLRHYGDLLVLKGIDIIGQTENEEGLKTETINYGRV